MSTRVPATIDESARLILMEDPAIDLRSLYRQLAEMHGEMTSSMIGTIWERYRGYDGRRAPTHDVETGQPLR